MRKSTVGLVLCAFMGLLLLLMFVQARFQRRNDISLIHQMTREVRDLELTDLCLFTEARYSRHLSQADRFSAFQDHPVALEHFPAGSLTSPPAGLRRGRGPLD